LNIVPLVDEGLGNSSYFVSLGDGRALVVDPSRDPKPYLDLARRLGLQVAFALETHLHADFISGSRELAAQGGSILAPTASQLATEYHGLADGEQLDVGGLTLEAIGTPGHTPEHLSYLLLEGSAPVALFSGGALLHGGAARTDLISGEQTEPLARELYRSVRERLSGLPDSLAVFPTHGGGSFCSAGADGQRTTTLGQERHANPLFMAPNEDAFARMFLKGLGTYPPYFLRLRDVNRRGAPLYGTRLRDLRSLPIEDFRRHSAMGATLIDARPLTEFAAGHIQGSLSIALRPAFVSWLGWLVPENRALLFVLSPDQDREDLVRQCLKIGYENLVGELEGGMASWRSAGLPESTIELRGADDDLLGTPLDVRQASEWALDHIPGATHVELGSLTRAAATLPPGPLTIYCRHGDRSMTAASLLDAAGRRNLAVLDGGFEAWASRHRSVAVG